MTSTTNLPIYLSCIWILIVLGFGPVLTSLFSGWFALSKRFRATIEPTGVTRRVVPIFHVQMRHQGCGSMRMTTAEDGLYLSMPLISRIAHPPLAIPWSEIQIRGARFLWIRQFVLTLGIRERIPLRISERIAHELGIVDGPFGGKARTFDAPPRQRSL